jgi:hypothetical protein
VSKYYARYKVNHIVSSYAYHEDELHNHSIDAKIGEFSPTMSPELTEANHTATDMTREKEIISLAIGNSD